MSKRGITGLDGRSIMVSTDTIVVRASMADPSSSQAVVVIEANAPRVLSSPSLAWALADALRAAAAEIEPAYLELMEREARFG